MWSTSIAHGATNAAQRRLDGAIEELAIRQGGVVSRSQLLEVGLSPDGIARRHARRDLIRLHRGVYAVGHRRLTSRARELPAVMACGPGALLSHRSAGSPPRGRRSRPGIVVHQRRFLGPEDRMVLEDIPITSVARTIVDLASSPQLERMLDAAERAGTLDVAGIECALGRLRRQPGRGRLLPLLEGYRPEPAFTRSEAERRFAALCRRYGLPMPQVNLWIEAYEIDFFWPDAALAVEMD